MVAGPVGLGRFGVRTGVRIAKEPLRVRVGDVASKDTELRRAGSGDIVASNDTDGRLAPASSGAGTAAASPRTSAPAAPHW